MVTFYCIAVCTMNLKVMKTYISIFFIATLSIGSLSSLTAQTCNPGGPAGSYNFFNSCPGATGGTGSSYGDPDDYTIQIGNNKTVVINGDVTIAGTLTIVLVGSTSRLLIQAPYTLYAGNVVFSGSATGKVIEVESGATLDVPGDINFGGLDIELDGEGTINSGSISGADNVSCTNGVNGGSGTCPTINNSGSCSDGGSGLCGDPALPIDLAYFEATPQENAVKIKWITATEENNDYFEILRSKDGVNYNVIATIDGAGNSTQALSYEYIDKNPLFGQSYYKLKQTDFDGKNETFSAKSVYVSTLSDLVFSPNPVENGNKLTIYTGANSDESVSVEIMSVSGKTLISEKLTGEQSQINIPSEIERGVYFLKVSSGSKQFVKRLLVK